MFWDDIVFKHPKQLDHIPKGAIVMEWGYEGEHPFDRDCRILKEKGMRFYVCPGTSMWNSITGRNNNAIANIMSAAKNGSYYGAEGFLLTEWGDGGHPQFPAAAYFPLVLGGAVSWNCGNQNVELAYEEKRALIPDCKKYVDSVLYKVTGQRSLADIAFRMGNYYLLEDSLAFNGTELLFYVQNPDELTDEKKRGFKRVSAYMQTLRDEINDVKAEEMVLRELIISCDIVILIADYLCGKKNRMEFDRIMTEYKVLWNDRNHPIGNDIFENLLRKAIERMT